MIIQEGQVLLFYIKVLRRSNAQRAEIKGKTNSFSTYFQNFAKVYYIGLIILLIRSYCSNINDITKDHFLRSMSIKFDICFIICRNVMALNKKRIEVSVKYIYFKCYLNDNYISIRQSLYKNHIHCLDHAQNTVFEVVSHVLK